MLSFGTLQFAVHSHRIQFTGPFGDDQRCDAVADDLGQRSRLGHEAIDAEHQRQLLEKGSAPNGAPSVVAIRT